MRERDGKRETRRADEPIRPAAPGDAEPGIAGLLWLQRAAGNSAVVAAMDAEGDGPSVQRSVVHDVLRSSGKPLDSPVREEMEKRLDADFSSVRVHTGSDARRSAAGLGARAYTSGEHVVVGEGGADRHTLAHELIHVLQQRSGPVSGTDAGGGVRVSDPADRFEREAERGAHRALSGPAPAPRPGHVHGAGTAAPSSSGTGQIQRAPTDDRALPFRKRPSDGPPESKRRKVADSSSESDSTELPPGPDRTARSRAEHREQAQQRDERVRGRVLPWLLEEQTLADYLDYRTVLVLSGMERFLPASQQGPGGDANATPLPTEHGEPSGKELRQLILAKVRERLAGVTDETMTGVLRIMASHGAPGRVLGDDPVRSEEGGQAAGSRRQAAHDLLPEMLKHVGYRQYAAQQGSEMTLEDYSDQVLQHAQLTALLGSLPPEVRFPIRDTDQAVYQAVGQYLDAWLADTRRLHGETRDSAPKPQDKIALGFQDLIQPRESTGQGHHFSVVDVGPTTKAIYTNRPLDEEQIRAIEDHLKARKQQLEDHLEAMRQQLDEEQIRAIEDHIEAMGQQYEFHYHDVDSRSSWGPEHGVGRHQKFEKSYPFHSELQQTLDKEPWEIRDYTGNAYRECAQCMRAFQALGVPASLRGEAHGRKSNSVIPPRIRANTVYLQHYLGAKVWAEWQRVLSQAWSRLETSSDTSAGTGGDASASTAEHVPLTDAERDVLVKGLASLKTRINALRAAGPGDEKWRSWLGKREMKRDGLATDLALSSPEAGDIAELDDVTISVTELRTKLEKQNAKLDVAEFFEFLATVERVRGMRYEMRTAHPAKNHNYVNRAGRPGPADR